MTTKSLESSAPTTEKPCAAVAMVGTEVSVRYGANPKKRRTVTGIIETWRYGTATIEKMERPADGEEALSYPSFDLRIKPNDGSRAVWVKNFKDVNNPRPSEIWND